MTQLPPPTATPSRMKVARFIVLLTLVAMVAVVSCLAVFQVIIRSQLYDVNESVVAFHKQLDLDSKTRNAVALIEETFETDRDALMAAFNAATRELAVLLEQEESFSEAVEGQIARIHHIHGQLQALSIRQFFEILAALPPEKRAELRQLASAELSQPE